MKKLKITAILALVLCMLISLFSGTAYADYGYTVRIFAGNQGSFDGESVIVLNNQSPGDIKFDIKSVTVKNPDKYFVKGVKLSGRDNNEFTDTIHVDRDVDYVVAYGLRGSEISFTIIMKASDTGVELGRETIYGNKDDTLLIKAPYIDNYVAEAKSVSTVFKTNSEFDLIYYPESAVERGSNAAGTVPSDVANTSDPDKTNQGDDNDSSDNMAGIIDDQDGQPGGDSGEREPEIGSVIAEPENNEVDESKIGSAAVSGSENGQSIEIAEIIEFVQSDLSDYKASFNEGNNKILFRSWGKIAVGAAAIILIGFVYWFLLFYRKKNQKT